MGRKLSMRITRRWLRKHGACKGSLVFFSEVFPEGAEVTIENAFKAVKNGLDLDWLVHECLPREMIARWHTWRGRHWTKYEERVRGRFDPTPEAHGAYLRDKARIFVGVWTLQLEKPPDLV